MIPVAIFCFLLIIPSTVGCDIKNEWIAYLRSAATKFEYPVYDDNDNCVNYFLYFKALMKQCNIRMFLYPVYTESCRKMQQFDSGQLSHLKAYTNDFPKDTPMISYGIRNTLNMTGFDSDKICSDLKTFNGLEGSKKTTENYADVYQSSASLVTYAFSQTYLSVCKYESSHFSQCILDTDMAALKYFNRSPKHNFHKDPCVGDTVPLRAPPMSVILGVVG